jgi:hypothetical protein
MKDRIGRLCTGQSVPSKIAYNAKYLLRVIGRFRPCQMGHTVKRNAYGSEFLISSDDCNLANIMGSDIYRFISPIYFEREPTRDGIPNYTNVIVQPVGVGV